MFPLGVLSSARVQPASSIQFVGAAQYTFPTHQAGDLIIAAAWSWPPGGWASGYTQLLTDDDYGMKVGYRIAVNSSTTWTTWPGSWREDILVYRNATIGTYASASDESATWAIPALPGLQSGSWVAAGTDGTEGAYPTFPGITTRASVGTGHGIIGDTNGAVSSWSTVSIANPTGVGWWAGWSVELRPA